MKMMHLVLVIGLGLPGVLLAEDLSDNDVCLECHEGQDRGEPKDPTRPRVHTPEGGFFVESHEMWSCIDCHTWIEEIPHPDEVKGGQVDCLNCHDEIPSKE